MEYFLRNKNNEALGREVREFSKKIDWKSPFAVTLTMKLAYHKDGCTVPLTPERASQNLKHFLNILNCKAFGKGGMRKGMKLTCLPTIEDNGVRLHFHLCLEKPEGLTDVGFAELIERSWAKTRFGYRQIDAKPCHDTDGWIDYITKYRTKSEFLRFHRLVEFLQNRLRGIDSI